MNPNTLAIINTMIITAVSSNKLLMADTDTGSDEDPMYTLQHDFDIGKKEREISSVLIGLSPTEEGWNYMVYMMGKLGDERWGEVKSVKHLKQLLYPPVLDTLEEIEKYFSSI